jgi:hypothetical protein
MLRGLLEVDLTTNYDRCLEAFWRENVRVTLDTGFRDKTRTVSTDGTLHAEYFLYSGGSKLQFASDATGRLRLVKLHGSTTWLIRKDTGEIEEKQFDIDQGESYLGTGKTALCRSVHSNVLPSK